ncbi:MAG: NAD(P)-dependent oxidoreductase, partial [Commensalibacter sp.]|nr:NAD(P)-dependent oxidoreductase [Commensalibacter sp.]
LPQLWNEPSLKLSPSGTIKIDKKTFSTSLDGVYAGGEIVRGASLVVWAIRDGREAAHQIDRYLSQKEKHSVEEKNTKEKVV